MNRVVWIRTAVVVGFILLLELLCRFGVIGRMTMIPPSEMATHLWRLLQSGRANADIAETLSNVAVAFVSAVVGGFVIGSILHSLPRHGERSTLFLQPTTRSRSSPSTR